MYGYRNRNQVSSEHECARLRHSERLLGGNSTVLAEGKPLLHPGGRHSTINLSCGQKVCQNICTRGNIDSASRADLSCPVDSRA